MNLLSIPTETRIKWLLAANVKVSDLSEEQMIKIIEMLEKKSSEGNC